MSLEIQEPTRLTSLQKQTLIDRYKNQENGFYKGNILFIDSKSNPRLKFACLRITPPKFTVKGIKKLSDKELIYIARGGAVFYSESELNYQNNKGYPILKLKVTDSYSIKFLCAFLKSSFFLWYVKNKFGDFDFYTPEIFNYITVPTIHNNNPTEKQLITKIETSFDNIVQLEKAFLKINWGTIKDPNDYINQHNEKTKTFFNEIDESIYSLLKLREEEISIIKESLRANYIFIPE